MIFFRSAINGKRIWRNGNYIERFRDLTLTFSRICLTIDLKTQLDWWMNDFLLYYSSQSIYLNIQWQWATRKKQKQNVYVANLFLLLAKVRLLSHWNQSSLDSFNVSRMIKDKFLESVVIYLNDIDEIVFKIDFSFMSNVDFLWAD